MVSAAAVLRIPSQARAIRTRAALLMAGEREFSTRGYASTTSKTIAERAGVATGTFYQYFNDKDALLHEVARQRASLVSAESLDRLANEADRSAALQPDTVRQQLGAIVTMVMQYHRDDPGLHAVLSERRHADPELDAVSSAAEHALVQKIAELLTRWRSPGDPLATAFVLFGMVEGSIHAHVLGTPVVSDERFIAALVHGLSRIALEPQAPAQGPDNH